MWKTFASKKYIFLFVENYKNLVNNLRQQGGEKNGYFI